MTDSISSTAKALFGQGRAAWARNYQAMSRHYGYPRIFDSGTQWSLGTAAQFLPFSWARDLAAETRNKHLAFSEFQNTTWRISGEAVPANLFRGDPATDIWRAEGLGAHLAGLDPDSPNPTPFADRCSELGIKRSFLLPVHTGGGLTLAEKILRKHLRSGKLRQVEEMLDEFDLTVERHSEPGLRGATFEALGLILQTMHPNLLDPVADHLHERRTTSYRLLWHGAGRGHYFDPFDLVLPSALRGRSFLSETDEAGLNRLAGYAWAVTLINLRSPATAAATLANLPLADKQSLNAAADGISGAALLWLTMTSDRSPLDRFDEALAVDDRFGTASQAATIRSAIARRLEAHPASLESLGSLFSFEPGNTGSTAVQTEKS